MNLSKTLLPLLLGSVLALPIAAAETTTGNPMFGDYQAKGFLSDYSRIAPVNDDEGTYRYRDSSVDFSRYNKLLVDRVKLWFKEDSEYKGIDPDELKELTDYFYEAINRAVGDAYPLVTEPGPDVLRLRIAVTDVVPNSRRPR